MKKIMFNDKYGLTKAVLEGRKTQTRRLEIGDLSMQLALDKSVHIHIWEKGRIDCWTSESGIPATDFLRFCKGEVVAVAQCYKDIFTDMGMVSYFFAQEKAGWRNKMFVKSERMPHQIKITNIRIEKLQDISNEDCLAEGVYLDTDPKAGPYMNYYTFPGAEAWYHTPRGAYEALIDRISGRGTWVSNPWVVVYEFELVK